MEPGEFEKYYLGNWDNLDNNKYIDKIQKEEYHQNQITKTHNMVNELKSINKKLDFIGEQLRNINGLQLVNGIWR